MARDSVPTVSTILRAKRHEDCKLARRPDGSIEMEANSEEEHGFAMDALERIGQLDQEPYYQELMQAACVAASSAPIPTPDPASKIPVIQTGKAVTQWLAEIKSSTRPKTFKIKTTAVEGFARHRGEKSSLKDARVNGPGNWLSNAFSRHVLATVGTPEKGKFSFHSLRKTVVQGLQSAGVTAELCAAYVGRELEHHGAYSGAPTMKEVGFGSSYRG